MKLTNKAQSSGEKPVNAEYLEQFTSTQLENTPYFPMLRVIADLLDEVQSGGEGYIILGTTQDRLSCSLVIKQSGQKDGAYGEDLVTMAEACRKWL